MILDSIDIYWILPSSPNGSYLVLRSFPRWSILELKYAFFQSFFFESHQRKKLVKRASWAGKSNLARSSSLGPAKAYEWIFVSFLSTQRRKKKKWNWEHTKKKREKKTVKGSRKFYGFDTRYGFFKKRKEREAQEIKQYQSKSIGTKQNPVKLAQIMENSPPPKPIRNQLNPRKVQEDTIRPHIIN